MLYKLQESPLRLENSKIDQLDGSIGTINDYAIAGDLRKMGYPVEESSSQKINFDKLTKGRIGGFAMLENMADDYLTRNNDKYTNIVKVHPALKTKPYYLLFSRKFVRKNQDLANRIWGAIGELKTSGEFEAIVAKHR